MDDNKQINLLNEAIQSYKNGEIIEAKDLAIQFINNITDFEYEVDTSTEYSTSSSNPKTLLESVSEWDKAIASSKDGYIS